MPRPLSSSSSSRHNSGTNATDKKAGGAVSPNSKRSSIRWFVHPPSVAFHSGKSPSLSTTTKKGLKSSSTSTTTTATTSPSLVLQEKAEVVPQEEERAPGPIVKTTTTRRPWSLSLSLLSGGGDRGGAGEQPRTPSPRQTGDTVEEVPVDEDSPMVLRLQQELEEAKEQIIALQRIKEMQEMEMKQWQQRPQSPPGSISILLNHNNEKANNYLTPTSTTDVTAEEESDVRQDDDDNSSSGASTTGSVVQELSSLLDQQQQEDTSVSLQQAARGATSDLLEETNHPITLEVMEQERNDEPAVIIDDDDEDDIDRAANYSLDPTFDNKFDQRFSIGGRASTPNSMTVLPVWKDLAFENASGIVGNDDEHHFDTAVLPPMEVTTIRDPKDNNNNTDQNSRLVPTGNVAQLLAIRLRDAEQRSSAYHQKLESAQDLVASLFRDLERARRTIQSLVTRNVSLSRNIKKLKLDQEDNMIPRGSLVKACVYITPVFVLCGGLEFFVSTILLVWMLVELEASWMEGDDDDDDEDDDENLTSEEEVLRKLQDKELFSSPIVEDMPIPKDIVLSNEEKEALLVGDEMASEAPDYQ